MEIEEFPWSIIKRRVREKGWCTFVSLVKIKTIFGKSVNYHFNLKLLFVQVFVSNKQMIPFILYFSDLWFPKSVVDYKMFTVVYYTLPESTIIVLQKF